MTTDQSPESESIERVSEAAGEARANRSRYTLLVLPALVPLWFALERLGIDAGAWLAEVIENLESVPPHYVALVLLFKAGESILTSLAWTHVLRATYPDREIRYRLVLASYQGGLGLNAVAPAKAGTVATFGILRLNIRDSRIPTLISTYAVNSLAFTVFAALNVLIVVALFGGTIAEHVAAGLRPIGEYTRDYPLIAAMGLTVALLAVVLLVRLARSRVGDVGDQLAAGGAILRQPRRYLASVAMPAMGSYGCRLGYTATFMAAFDIPVTLETVFLMLGARLVASLLAVTPGGFGVSQAIDAAIMSVYAPVDVIAAASLSRDMLVKAWNIAFGLALAIAVFGWHGATRLIRRRSDLVQQAAASDERTDARPALSASPSADIRR